MVLSEYVTLQESPRKNVKREIADACKVSYVTAWRWCKGEVVPPPLARSVISELLQMPEQELFPNVCQ